MAVQLDQVVPFGRSFDEYVKMFSLSEADLQGNILSVADGPASFNAEGTERGYRIQSIDPLYGFEADEVRDRFYAVLDNIIDQVVATPEDWVWSYHKSPDDLKANRVKVTERFYQDYVQGKREGRYEIGELPKLKYQSDSFDLGLCSHFLFLYSEQLGFDFHVAALEEMLRTCNEVRVFPLLTLRLEKSPFLADAIVQLQKQNYRCTLETVDYQLQRGGNEMLRIQKG